MPLGDPKAADKSDTQNDDGSPGSAVKKKHGFLEYDGTGYRLVTKTVKPEKANHVRLKPVTQSKNNGWRSDLYTIEVLDDNDKGAKTSDKPAEQKPRIAVERVENIDKIGAEPEKKKEHKADVGVGLKVSESSELMLGRGLVVERKDGSGLDSRDDGWRFRFKTNF